MIIKNKIRKTHINQRGTYKYIFDMPNKNGEYKQQEVVITAGENGVTQLDIKVLHALDDSEVYYNTKNLRPKRTKEDKQEIEVWTKDYIQKFKEQHGYEPHPEDMKHIVNEVFPRNYNVSMDSSDIDFDHSELSLMTTNTSCSNEWSYEMSEAMCHLTDRQIKIIELLFIKKYTQKEVALLLDITPAAVNKQYKKALQVLKDNL